MVTRFKSKYKGSHQGTTLNVYEAVARIRSLVAQANIEEAIEGLKVLVEVQDAPILNEVIGLQARLSRVEKDETAGLLNWEDVETEKNRITQHLLRLVDALDEQPTTHSPIRELSAAEKKRRAGYLQDLKADVENRLKVSIHHARLIDLGIDDTPSATRLPWIYSDPDSKREFKDYKEAFEVYGRRMLLLGGPGSGKTITLLHIAQQLIDEAEKNPAAPIPLLVNLSKFQLGSPQNFLFGLLQRKRLQVESADKRIERWLMTEFTANPFIITEIAKTWIEEGRIAALLDGLDEVNDEHRADLVKLLNATYLRQYPDAIVVVCSRINEYRPLQDREETTVALKGGVTLQPLSSSKINEYLELAQAAGLREALLTDETLYQMAQTPLTLSMMTLAYGGSGPSTLLSHLSFTERRHHMMGAYVARMLQRKERRDRKRQFDENPKNDVPLEQYACHPQMINTVLGWLAVRMSIRMQTAVSLNSLYSFLSRDINRDRRSGVWWAAVVTRAPIILVSALLVGFSIAPMTRPAWLQAFYISLLSAALFVPIASLFRSPDRDGNLPNAFPYIRYTLITIIVSIATFIIAGMSMLVLSSTLPFGIPPLPMGILGICLSIPFVFSLLEVVDNKSNLWLFAAGTVAVFFIAVFVMNRTGSRYGWYIPAVSVVTLQTTVLIIDEWRTGNGRDCVIEVVGIISLIAIFAVSIRVLDGFGWHLSLAGFTLVAVIILSTVPSALLLLIALCLFCMLGGIWNGPHGAVVGGLLYSYLVVSGLLIVAAYELNSSFLTRLSAFIRLLVDYTERLADRYLLSPVLLRVLAVGHCLPLRPRRFFQYAEQALLLKRSAGDIEFMHRLLRDYFALRDLQPLLIAADSNKRLQAIRNLGFQGDAAIDALAEFVRNENPDVREAAAWALGRVVSPATVVHIETALNDPVPNVRRAAVLSTKNLVDHEKRRLLNTIFDDPELSVQRAVFEVVLALGVTDERFKERFYSTVSEDLSSDKLPSSWLETKTQIVNCDPTHSIFLKS